MSFKEFSIKTHNRTEMVDITSEVQRSISDEISDGVAVIYCPHTTAGITINENADPSVKGDMTKSLNKLIPFKDNYTHLEGNSDAHIKASLTGLSVTVPVVQGRLTLGTWQGIYFCEFDGPRNRKFCIKTING
jgi:secondary thiamine-phosphate synthase enzyme